MGPGWWSSRPNLPNDAVRRDRKIEKYNPFQILPNLPYIGLLGNGYTSRV